MGDSLERLLTAVVPCLLLTATTVVAQERDLGLARQPQPLPAIDIAPLRLQIQARPDPPVAARLSLTPGLDDFVAAMAPVWTRKFRPILRLEYRFVRRICPLNPDQERSVARTGEKALADAARAYAVTQFKRRGPRGLGDYPFPQPRKLIQQALVRALGAFASPREAERYQDEVERREAHRKLTSARNMVSQLVMELKLSDSQRDRIYQALLERWDDSWSDSLNDLQEIEEQIPQEAGVVIVPHLSAVQASYWRENVRNRDVNPRLEAWDDLNNDDPDDDEELAEAGRAPDR